MEKIIKRIKASASPVGKMHQLLQNQATVCQETNCPNQGECFQAGVATILVMGKICTRNCLYCNIATGKPDELNPAEPEQIVNLLFNMRIRHAVLTSVSRDDIADGGAQYLSDVALKIKEKMPQIKMEMLLPDFKGNSSAWQTIANAPLDIWAHNLEMVPSLFVKYRPQGNWSRSLQMLQFLSKFGMTKSGFMVGLGESQAEVIDLMNLIKNQGVKILTIGQYLPPTDKHPPAELISDSFFSFYKEIAEKIGFHFVFSGPFVRSSYLAHQVWQKKFFSLLQT